MCTITAVNKVDWEKIYDHDPVLAKVFLSNLKNDVVTRDLPFAYVNGGTNSHKIILGIMIQINVIFVIINCQNSTKYAL